MPSILSESDQHSYRAAATPAAAADNRLIHGDNLPALEALLSEFAGQIACVYIDPPYNTQQSFAFYEDGIEHGLWLERMRERLLLIHQLLAPGGSLFVHIGDQELAYLVVLLDSIFGRAQRLFIVTFKQGSATGHKAINRGCVSTTNFILIYAKDKAAWQPRRLFTARLSRDTRYNQFIENMTAPYSEWRLVPLFTAFARAQALTVKQARAEAKEAPHLLDDFVTAHADRVVQLARPNHAAVSEAARQCIELSRSNPQQIYRLERDLYPTMYFRRGQRLLFYASKLQVIDGQLVAAEPLTTLWDDLLSNNLHKEGGLAFPKGKKPEGLLRRILDLSTVAGDWVLDAYAGSGTTGAVAHKMGRRWIMIEEGEQCFTHVLPRLKSVIDGTDQAGVSKAVGWQRGGGYRFFQLG